MKFLDKAKEINPTIDEEKILNTYCPCSFDLEDDNECYSIDRKECVECWNREMQNTETKSYNQNLRERIIEEIYHAIDSDRQMCIGADIQNYLLKVLEDNTDYNKGLNDAWELAKQYEKMSMEERKRIFGVDVIWEILNLFTPQEALAKLKAYEDSKIEVGDIVVIPPNEIAVVTKEKEKDVYVCFSDGSSGYFKKNAFKKTGKHIDIKSFLEQIGE